TCHLLPDADPVIRPRDDGRTALTDLSDRLPAAELAAFLGNPHARYPDGRMPRLPMAPDVARDLAAYLLLWSKPARREAPIDKPPTATELRAVSRRLSAHSPAAAGAALVRAKCCAACHPGLGPGTPADVPLPAAEDGRGCLSGRSVPRYTLAPPVREAVAA